MPIIEVTLASGRPAEDIRELISAVTAAVCSAINAPRESVRVIVREIPPTHFAAGDVTLAERSRPGAVSRNE